MSDIQFHKDEQLACERMLANLMFMRKQVSLLNEQFAGESFSAPLILGLLKDDIAAIIVQLGKLDERLRGLQEYYEKLLNEIISVDVDNKARNALSYQDRVQLFKQHLEEKKQ